MTIRSQTFAIITNRLIVKCWKKLNIPTKYEKNRTKTGTVLSETVLSGDPLYLMLSTIKSCFQFFMQPVLKFASYSLIGTKKTNLIISVKITHSEMKFKIRHMNFFRKQWTLLIIIMEDVYCLILWDILNKWCFWPPCL